MCRCMQSILSTFQSRAKVSEAHACSLMEAVWQEVKELPGAEAMPSIDLIQKAATLSQTGHACRLSNAFEDYKLSADIHISYVDIGTQKQHPVFRIRDFLGAISDAGKSDLLFCGHTESDYMDFWEMWRLLQPQHPIYRTHERNGRLKQCVPMFFYADEGTGQKRRGLMVLQYQPILGHGSSRASDLNMSQNSLSTRFLFSVLAAHIYSGKLKKNKPLHCLVEHFAKEMGSLFEEPIMMEWGGKLRQVYLVCLGIKGDLAAIVKIGQLTRNYQRETPTKPAGPGICHLCHGGKAGCAWHNISFENMKKMKEDLEPPWKKEPHLVSLIPQCPLHKPEFFHLDLFHCAHKGVWGDIAANTIASKQKATFYL